MGSGEVNLDQYKLVDDEYIVHDDLNNNEFYENGNEFYDDKGQEFSDPIPMTNQLNSAIGAQQQWGNTTAT